jgi:hypothetical protein
MRFMLIDFTCQTAKSQTAFEIVIASAAKQSILSFRCCMDCFAALAMTQTHFRDLAARCARGLQKFSAPKTEGVGNAGCPMHPQPRVRYGNKYAHEYSQRATGITRHSRTQWFTAYIALSPVIGLSCHRHLRINACPRPVGPTCHRKLDAGVEASGPHDFTVRISAVRHHAV